MSRTRTLDQMAQDALRLVDLENAAVRFPTGAGSEVYEAINKGVAYVYGIVIQAQDHPHYLSEAIVQITQTPPLGGVTSFPLPLDFMQIVSVSWACSANGPWQICEPYRDEGQRTMLLGPGYYGALDNGPYLYGFAAVPTAMTVGIPQTSYSLELIPQPPLNSYARVRYIPSPPRLVNPTDSFDGVLAWEDAVSTWGAILLRRKDDLETGALEGDMARHIERIQSIARRRDRSRPPKTQIVRGWGRRGAFGRWGW